MIHWISDANVFMGIFSWEKSSHNAKQKDISKLSVEWTSDLFTPLLEYYCFTLLPMQKQENVQ